MWEEDVMRKTIWDIPNYHGCNKWSHDGMLAVLTANSIQVFTPTFRHNSFYLARWIHLEMLGENDGVPKKSKVYVAPKESFTASTADDLIKWMSTVNSTDDRSFGKLDINSLYFKKALWSPPGLGIFSSSFLSTLLSDGSLLLIVMGGSSRANHRLFTNDRRFNVHMFSSSIALDISSLFQEWLLHNGNGAGLTGQTTKIDSDSDSADDSRGKSRKERFEPPSSPSNTCMINEIACYPNLLSYNGIQRGRISCMILATGSSSGHINLWGVRSASGSLLEASCVSSVLLTESSLNTASSSSSEFLREHSYSQSISCIEFLTTASDFSNSSHGNFSTRLLCGTSEGFLVIFDISSVHKNIQNGEINSGNFDLRYVEDDFPILSMGQPTHILRPFDSPIDSIIISRKERYSLYLRSGVKLVQTDNNFRHIFPVENIHSHIVTSISVLDNREYSMIGNDILLTSSLDGDLKLWMEPSDRSYPYVPYHNTNINKENNHNTQIDGTSIIELDKNMKQSRDENCNLNFVQLFNVNDTLNNNNLSYVDITCDPLQLIFSITHLIPSSIIDSREVQMNKNLERSHCGVYFFLSPILDLKWITIPENVLQVIRSVIFNAPKTPHSNTSDCIINSRNCDDGGIGRSNCTNSSGNEHGHDERKEEKEDFKSYYHNYCEEYSEVKGYSGVSFCWVKSVDEVVQHYVDSHMNTAEGSLTINERTELGIVDTNKRYQEKGKTDDDDENEEVDGVAGKTGISDVAHKVKNLLYPDIEKLLDDSFEVATSAAYTISVDLNALVGQDNEHTNGSNSNINTSINIDTSYDNFQEEILSKRFDSNLDCIYLYEDGDSFLSAVLLLPINDERVLYYKLKLWKVLHQILRAVSQSKGIPLGMKFSQLARMLRKNIQIGIAVCSAKRILREYEIWRNRKKKRKLRAGNFLSSKELLSLSLVQKLLQRCVGYLSDALGQVIARCQEGDEEEEEVVEYNQILDNGSSSKNVPPSSSSRNNTSTLNINGTALSEICSVCESKVEFILPSDADGTAQTSSCRECKTEFDRCSITLLTIGFEPIVEGHVLKCSVCQAVGLLHPSNNRNNAEVRIRDEINVATCKSKGNEFNWSWWDGKAPYCPYCGILMVPLT